MPALTKKEVKKAFARKDLTVITDSKDLKDHLLDLNWKRKNLLMMSSGTFDGLDLDKLAKKITR